MKSIKFVIKQNIDFKEIERFTKFYKFAINNNRITQKYYIKIVFDPISNIKISEEVDPIYLSYLTLFLIDYRSSYIEFYFKNEKDSDRPYSLKLQLEHIRYTLSCIFSIKENQLSISGSKTKAKLFSWNVKKDGQSVIDKTYGLSQSKSYIPPLIIQEEFDLNYFASEIKINHPIFPLYKIYYLKLIEEIRIQISTNQTRNNQDEYFYSLELKKLSFLELTLLRLLISEDLFKDKRTKNKENLLNINKERIKQYVLFVQNIGSGLYELAKNILEHSTFKRGVITARIFDKERLIKLKDQDTHNFIDERKLYKYKIKKTIKRREVTKQFFLDVNVIDFGKETIREKYIKNIEQNINDLKEFNIEDYSSDINFIKSNQFDYKDFFVIDVKKLSRVKHQQNKLISRIGLHYFTNILKDSEDAFIKTSSLNHLTKPKNEFNDGVIIYNKKNKIVFEKTENCNFIKQGTTFNCIIPIKITNFKSSFSEINIEPDKSTVEINTFQNLEKYEIVKFDEKLPNKSKLPIYLYDENLKENFGYKNKFKNVAKVYYDIEKNAQKVASTIRLLFL